MRTTSLIFAAISLIVVSSPPVSAQASTGSSLSVSPGIISNTLDPGKSFTTVITLANASQQPMAIHSSVAGLVPDQKVDPTYKAAYDSSAWFKISEPDFLLPAGQAKQVSVEVSVPANAEPGGHYATIYFESFAPNQQAQQSVTSINPRIGVLSLLVVNGAIREHASVGALQTPGVQVEAGPTNFAVSVTNDGNIHLLPSGTIVVRNIFGQKVKTMAMPVGIVLPGTTRTYESSWEHGLRFGIYNAEATITVGSQKTELKAKSARFVLFPLIVAIPVVLVVGCAVLFVLTYRSRRRGRRNVPEVEELEESEGSKE